MVTSVVDARDCLFCQFATDAEKEKVAEYTYCYVVADGYPVSPGHLLVISREHASDWFSASKETRAEIVEVLDRMKGWLDRHYRPDGYNIGMNCGTAAGQTIHHLHVHLIPRYEGDVTDPRGGVRGVIPSKQKY